MKRKVLKQFVRFIQGRLKKINRMITDPRKDPRKVRIPQASILAAHMMLPLRGAQSLLAIDVSLRDKVVEKTIGVRVSDTHLERMLRTWALPEIRAVFYDLFKEKMPQFKRWYGKRIACLDGTSQGGEMYSVLYGLGRGEQRLIMDIERMEGPGKELGTSLRLLKRYLMSGNVGGIDLLLLDGLYFSGRHMEACLAGGIDVLIKTGEKGLNVIRDAEGMFAKAEEYKEGVRVVRGVDVNRAVEYKIYRVDEIKYEKVSKGLTVVKVEERGLKKEEEREFYLITTCSELGEEELRELGHRRWAIENEGFKSLNSLCGTKRRRVRDKHASYVLFLLRSLGWNLFFLFYAEMRERQEGEVSYRISLHLYVREMVERALVLGEMMNLCLVPLD